MNVLQTQHSLFRQLDAAAIVAQIQQAAEQAQRQMAISHLREARHLEGSISQAEGAHESAAVSERGHPQDERRPRGGGARELTATDSDQDADIMDAPNIGPLGHHFDVVG
jgi:hypothetical protein